MTTNDSNSRRPKQTFGTEIDPRKIGAPRVEFVLPESIPIEMTSAPLVREPEFTPTIDEGGPIIPTLSLPGAGQPIPVLPAGNHGQSSKQTRALVPQHPLRRHSMLGRADELETKAMDTTPLLGNFVMKGQATMIYAAPNTGKTLILLHLVLEAIEQGRIAADRVFYVNADDSSKGLAVKARLLQDVGAHMLVPGL